MQLAIKDFLKPGDCALDIGANIGGVSVAMSRMVGPRGSIHSFEANPRLVPRLQNNLVGNQVRNATVVPKAVFSKSGETVSFYCENSYFETGSGLGPRGGDYEEVTIETVSVDEYCRLNRLRPSVIKIDVEGAEFQVLAGAENVIREHKPVIVFEYDWSHSEDNPLDLLEKSGYRLFDVNLIKEVNAEFYRTEFERQPTVNILAIPSEQVAKSPYASINFETVANYTPAGACYIDDIPLKPGRYLVKVGLDGQNDQVAHLGMYTTAGERLIEFGSRISHLKQHPCSHLVFEIGKATTGRLTLKAEPGIPHELTSVEVLRFLK